MSVSQGKMTKCADHKGRTAICMKKNGRLHCKDSDGQVEYCHYRNGKMTCSDVESHVPKLVVAANWFSKSTPVSCKPTGKRSVACTKGRQTVNCIRRVNGRLDCTDDENNKRFCRRTANGNMTCSDDENGLDLDDDLFDWDMEAMIQEMSAQFMI